MKMVISKADGPSEIEQLGDELSLRDLHVTLAPDSNDELVLEVSSFRRSHLGAAVRAGRVYWRDGAFWWSRLAELERLPDITSAIERITASLHWWSRQHSALVPSQLDDS
jgi:hypothetical protein